MQLKPVIYLVQTQCTPDLDEKFNNWYTETHIPMLLKSEHISGVTLYKLAPTTDGEYPTYLALHEHKDRQAFEAWYSSPELAAARMEVKETWGDKGFEIKWRAVYEPVNTWSK